MSPPLDEEQQYGRPYQPQHSPSFIYLVFLFFSRITVVEKREVRTLGLSRSGADPGFKKRGSNIFDVVMLFEVGDGDVVCMSTLRHSSRDSVILETKIVVI